MTQLEEFKKITNIQIPPGAKLLPFAPYYITKDGKTVFSMITWRPLKQHLQVLNMLDKDGNKRKGYLQVFLKCKDGKSRWFRVHRLVAMMFVRNYKPGKYKVVGHKDNDKLNNYYKNLYWTDYKGNMRDAINSGLDVFGRNSLNEHPRQGKKASAETKQKQSQAKLGENHPKFKGWYVYEGARYPSMNQLGKAVGKHAVQVQRMVNRGEVTFEAKI